MRPTLPPDYTPGEDEDFMNPLQQEYFRQKLEHWRQELLEDSGETRHNLQNNTLHEPDTADRASLESGQSVELRARDRDRKLITKIDKALQRLDEGSYGYCEETGHPIGLKRLQARPIATLSFEAQERHEQEEKVRRQD